jgi:hypothetical protein
MVQRLLRGDEREAERNKSLSCISSDHISTTQVFHQFEGRHMVKLHQGYKELLDACY